MRKYKHDCNSCIFLGNYKDKDSISNLKLRNFDVYYCPENKDIIFRYGEDSYYISYTLDNLKEEIAYTRFINRKKFVLKKLRKLGVK